MVDFFNFWRDKKIFLTGHTGFKGSWLLVWLERLGADVFGYALPPDEPSLYRQLFGDEDAKGVWGDIRDYDGLRGSMNDFSPDIVLHLAAQPLVRYAYRNPRATYETNVMGTVNVLEAARHCDKPPKSVVAITTDKCYRDMGWVWGYREDDPLGGADPYSSSKSCAELLCDSWRMSYFRETGPLLATARAGNVIGGGDWAEERLIPDVIRSFCAQKPLQIRCPDAVRPWQHVMEPIFGYMMLAKGLFEGERELAAAWNFGPDANFALRVEEIVARIARLWGADAGYEMCADKRYRESKYLRLDSSKAKNVLNWSPLLTIEEAIALTAEGYRRMIDGERARDVIEEQISNYMNRIKDHA